MIANYGPHMVVGKRMMGDAPLNSPILQVGLVAHLLATVLVLVILLLVAMWLWEKVKGERYKNAEFAKKHKS